MEEERQDALEMGQEAPQALETAHEAARRRALSLISGGFAASFFLFLIP